VVISCYEYHLFNGVDVGRDLRRIAHRGGGRYKRLLEHIARCKGRRQALIRVRQRRQAAPPPILTPQQIKQICEACASWEADTRAWRGSVRNRPLWMLLSETGVRFGRSVGVAAS
jgi:integrase